MDNSTSTSNHKKVKTVVAHETIENVITFEELEHPGRVFVWNGTEEAKEYHGKKVKYYQGIRVGNEAEIVGHVKGMISEIIHSVPQLRTQNISVRLELMNKARRRPDVWVLRVNLEPFFVIEVNKPGIFDQNNQNSLAKIHGQMFDYLVSLHRHDGLIAPYGMICTFEQSQICWLANTKQNSQFQNRQLHVSQQIYGISDAEYKNTITAIAIVIINGYESPVTPLSERSLSGYYNVFQENQMAWELIPMTRKKTTSCQITIT